MLGRTPGSITAIRPLKDGVIADFEVTEEMLRHFIQRVHHNRFAHPRVVVCVPSGVTGVEKRAVEEACLSAGARQAYLIEEPMAAAIGAGLPVAEPTGSMVLDIGGGTSEVAVISLGGHRRLRVDPGRRRRDGRGDRQPLQARAQDSDRRPDGRGREARDRGRLPTSPTELTAEIRGRDMVTGLPRTIVLTSTEIRTALEEPVSQIVSAVKDTLDRTPPELAGDIMDRGHHARGRRRAAARHGGAHADRVPDARPAHRVAAHLRRGRVGPLARGVRGDPPDEQALEPPAASWRRRRVGRRVPQGGPPAPRCAGGPDRRLPRADLDQLQRGRQRAAQLDPAGHLRGALAR